MKNLVAGAIGFVAALGLATALLGAVTAATAVPVAVTEPNAVAQQFGVTVKLVTHLDCSGTDAAGCFKPSDPNAIYVLVGMPEDRTDSVILHEIGHVMQHRLGQPINECAADAFAKSLGATVSSYNC